MNKLSKALLLLLLFIFFSCSKEEIKIYESKENDLEMQMIESYKLGYKSLKEGDALLAAKQFNDVESIYPQSIWAQQSVLMAAYSYYLQDYYYDALFELNRFVRTYPKNKNISYAHYLIALCHYEQIVDQTKNLEPIILAKKKFEYVLNNYPKSDYAVDSKYKINLVNDILASKELYIAKYYLKREKWIPAINRLKNITLNYDTTIYAPEALHRLVEVHYKIGLVEEATKYASILGYNYLSDEWYERSYNIFNKSINKKSEKTSILKELIQILD
tara:strand:+ start:626 stop:1447 length:822 start_codon:yes stop_codon:yes gene_type:complete